MQHNRVFVNHEGIVEISVVGDQTIASVQAMADQAIELSRQLTAAGKTAVILDNLQQIGYVPPEARKLVVELVKSTDYSKLAMLGANGLLQFGANLMLQATGKGARVKYFTDRDRCTAWLLRP